jgi:hypothetical protein
MREAFMRRNRRNAAAFRFEREQLRDLPTRRTTNFVKEEAQVTRCTTFAVAGVLYTERQILSLGCCRLRHGVKRFGSPEEAPTCVIELSKLLQTWFVCS